MQSVTVRDVTKGMGLLAAGLTLLTAYCQVHGLGTEGGVPIQVSFNWAISTSLWWGVAAMMLWFFRAPLLGLVDARRLKKHFAAVGFVFGVTLFAAGLVQLIRCIEAGSLQALGALPRRLLDLSPACALAAGLVVALLALRRSTAAAPVQAIADTPSVWIPLPEEPQLVLRKSDVSLIRSAGNYCELHAWGRVHLVRVTLKTLAERLGSDGFVQVHRTALVNSAHIRVVAPALAGRRLDVHLEGGLTVPVGRSFAQSLKRLSDGLPLQLN